MKKIALHLSIIVVLCFFTTSCSHHSHCRTRPEIAEPNALLQPAEVPAEVASLLGFDVIHPESTWAKGDQVVYELSLHDNHRTVVYYFGLTIQSTDEADEQYSSNMTCTTEDKTEMFTNLSSALPAHLEVFQKDKQPRRTDLLVPKHFLEDGLVGACDSNDTSETAKGATVLLTFMIIIQQDPALCPIMQKVIDPPLWSILLHGPNISVSSDFDKASPCQAVLGGTSFSGYRFPVDLKVNGKEGLKGHVTVIEPVPPFHTCGGIVSIEGRNERKPESHFSLKLISARQGSLATP